MENKYYTPEIEEFHIGFEYQYLSDEWTNFIMTVKIHPAFENYDISSKYFRVKYLDKEDIESLDFTEKNDVFVSNKTYLGIGTGDDKKLIIEIFENDIEIYWLENRGVQYTIFEGKIKNKSELKVLLKMLNI